jgi:hypothetical protein
MEREMDQIALPYRIALVAMLLVGALWLTVLRPRDAATDAPPPAAPGVTGLTNATEKARGAVGAANAASAATAQAPELNAEGAGEAAGAAPAAAAPKAEATAAKARAQRELDGVERGDPSRPLVRALAGGKVVVLLVAGRRAADDRAAREAVAGVDRRGGRVLVRVVAPRHVGRYEAITRDVAVTQAPTLLVVGPDRRARAITGFTTAVEADQAAGDAVARARRR